MPIAWGCLAVSLAALTWLLTVYRHITRIRPTQTDNTPDDSLLPGISVIVYARDNAADLRRTLPAILSQDYPAGRMEVIVVNDGSAEDVTDVVNALSMKHRNLRITFVPDEATNLSRKKLAVSLGIKAATREVVLLTCAEAMPASTAWARRMAEPFGRDEADVVLGWAYISGLKRAMARFDQACVGVFWLLAALDGHPYRGTGYNLAYRRELFFEAKGFSRSLNLHNGDDDLFVKQITTGRKTAVVLSEDARMEVAFQRPRAAFRDLRLRHCFTARLLPRRQALLAGISTIMLWLWVAATAVGCVFSLPNWFPACILLATIPALWIPLIINWLRTGRALGLQLAPALIPWEMLWRWIPNLRYKIRCGSHKRKNYTWHSK